MKKILYAGKTDIGKVRSENQDAMGKFPPNDLDVSSPKGQLFVIADGMGGHAGGREASRLAVETISKVYFAANSGIADSLTQAFNAANRAIYEYSINHPQFAGMGTTCIALVLQNSAAWVAHIGDSRLYRISKKKIEQVTKDHSKVAEMVRRGIITADEGRVHPERSMLYRAMGVRLDLEFDLMNTMEVAQDEYFLLCTDGLSGYVEPQELKEITLAHPPAGACDMLVDLANRRGGQDNITVQIIRISSGDSFLKTMFRTT